MDAFRRGKVPAPASASMPYMKDAGFGASVGRSPMVVGGVSTSDKIRAHKPTIYRDAQDTWTTRTVLPSAVPRYPETKHTMKKLVHNITAFEVTPRPGTENYDPVLLGGKSLVDHYPYASCTSKEVLVHPSMPSN